jgi:beta-glucanase (GH16 family)
MITIALVLAATLAVPACAQRNERWKLIWSDEFNAPAGSSPDPSKWAYDLGANGWGNRELQEYTDRPENVSHDGHSHLIIRALKTASGGYTSARIKTLGKFEVQYGRIAARIRVPHGQGIWPAFWMLGNDLNSAGWPNCGEIDIMEHIGKEPGIVHATVHGPGYSGAGGIGNQFKLDENRRMTDDFHVFEVRWTADRLTFFIDGKPYHEVTPANLPAGAKWVFDHPFFILLNLAVGGNWPGYPDDTTTFPQALMIDWVRVWEQDISAWPQR